MKKIIILVLIFLCGCTKTPPGPTLRVYLPENYINNAALEEFEHKTGIRVLCSTFANNEEMFEQVSTKKNLCDIVVAQDYMVTRMAEDELILPIEFEQIPNIANIDEEITVYSVP